MSTTSRRRLPSRSFWFTVFMAGFLAGCGSSLNKTVPNLNTNTNNNNNNNTTTTPTDPMTPAALVPSLPSFTPTTTASAKAQNFQPGASGNFQSSSLMGYTGLGDILAGGLFREPAKQGLVMSMEMGNFAVVSSELVPVYGVPSLANLGRSNEDVYMGGVVDVSVPGSMAEFFARHHDPNATRHCLTACQVLNQNGSISARIQSDYGGTSTTLGSVLLGSPRVALECVNFKDTIALYVNGRLAIAAKDPQPVNKQALFGISALNGRFRSLSAANLDTARMTNPIVFFETDFDMATGSLLPMQWQVSGSSGVAIINSRLVPTSSGAATITLANVSVRDIDVSMDYELSPANSKAAVVFRHSASGGYRAEVSFSGGLYQVSLFRSDQATAIAGPFTLPVSPSGTIRVRGHGNEIRVNVNGELRVRHVDSTFAQGSVGMMLQQAAGDSFLWRSFY